jgi:hypothetical protein
VSNKVHDLDESEFGDTGSAVSQASRLLNHKSVNQSINTTTGQLTFDRVNLKMVAFVVLVDDGDVVVATSDL